MGVGGGGGTVKSQRELQCVSIFSCDKKQVCAPFCSIQPGPVPCLENG